MKNIKTFFVFIILKVLEIVGIILLVIIFNILGRLISIIVERATSSNAILDYIICTLFGFFMLALILISIIIFFSLLYLVLKYIIRKNWEWAEKIMYRLK